MLLFSVCQSNEGRAISSYTSMLLFTACHMLTAVRNLGIKVLGTMRTGFDRPEAPSMNDATQVQRSQGRPSGRRFL